MEELSPLQLQDLCKQAAVSLGHPNLKEEQKKVVRSFLKWERHFCSATHWVWKESSLVLPTLHTV